MPDITEKFSPPGFFLTATLLFGLLRILCFPVQRDVDRQLFNAPLQTGQCQRQPFDIESRHGLQRRDVFSQTATYLGQLRTVDTAKPCIGQLQRYHGCVRIPFQLQTMVGYPDQIFGFGK